MGVSTDGIICFGWLIGADVKLPWFEEGCNWGDIEEWWCFDIHADSYNQTLFPWTEDGDYAEGWSENDPRFDAYDAKRKAHKEAHPVPVIDINSCSDDYPVWIIAVEGTDRLAPRGYPKAFNPQDLVEEEKELLGSDKLQEAKNFVVEYVIPCLDPEYDKIPSVDDPRWYLGSYWG